MIRRLLRLGGDRRGALSVEMAVAAPVLIMGMMGVIGAGLVTWTKTGLQAAAMTTARCVAVGSAACPTPKDYAVTLAGQWVFAGIISVDDVTVTSATTCNGATGQYTRVEITANHWVNSVLPTPQDTIVLSVTACYLSAAS